MSNATRTIADTARDVAALVDAGIAAQLPEPQTITVMSYAPPRLVFRAFEDVEAWAAHQAVPARRYVPDAHGQGDREFIEAEVDGVRLTSNRAVTGA